MRTIGRGYPGARRAVGRAGLAVALALAPATAARAGDRPTAAEIGEEQVYLTAAQAVDEIFDRPARVDTVRAVLGDAERAALHRRLGYAPPADSVTVYLPRGAGGALLGYAVVGEEVGKYRPITFLVGATPERKVRGVEVLVYRESRGGEIRRERFLRQYRGKSAEDPLRINRDVLNVAGATLSVGAMNRGVKRVLAVLDLLAARGDL